MRSVIARRFVSPSLILTTALLSGCMYSPYAGGYGGYGQQGVYPGAYPQYGAPIQTLTPGQQYIPGQTSPQGVYPGTTYPGTPSTYDNGSGGLQPIPDSNAPSYNSGSVKTPDPYFPSANTSSSLSPVADNSIQPATHSEPSQFQPLGGLQELRSESPMNNGLAEPAPTPTYGANPEPSDLQFQPPVAAQNPFESNAPTRADQEPDRAMPVFNFEKVAADELNPFGHDPDYKWVRGVVSQDPNDGTWSIVFDANPPETDQLAGHITLAQSPYLEQLEEGEVVEVQGEVDAIAKDALGKPVYLIRSITQLATSSTK